MSATIKDVAKMAEVSISTVSRVINDSKPVSPEVRKRVLEVIDELGYKPNEVARTLVTKKSFLIGVIATDIGNSYVAQIIRGIEEVGKMYNYDILLCSSYGDKETELKFIQLLNRKQVEGIILISEIINEKVKEQIDQQNIPFVYLNKYFYMENVLTVSIDDLDASYEMTNYLISLGHKNIIYVSTHENEEYSLEKFKIEGYKKAIDEFGEGDELICFAKGCSIEDGYDIGKEVEDLVEKYDATAVFLSHDELAIGLINYFYDCGVKVPDDISVAGYGDIKISQILRPKLTTIKEPYYDIGAVAIRKIIKELKEEKFDKGNIKLPFQIKKRESCGKIQAE
ncbi:MULTISPECIES: LacI family DNA-binding transcriptional regulator [Tissierellales]|jgi:LacI family transcriptional regulator|uniref:LacI family transcriptional regulator n=1 Tax=Acidilutibacter cellobiosedens TaxID=2507161 RepID=A0A410QEA3_9FIRM|nr:MULTISPECIES: LacI family DNA-binding transcriptional regulator [Tissierellales]MBE6083557.1 LacI family transcriptional regulator [Tissierellaceae bacterium]QAT62296.1 LacI family transcriptional regulator [Acidilutibacter cellobiosedens]SCL96864.1 Glucose-resistance amylase regulator [Sporanaerobacter sp. PP17-6a]